MKIEDSKCTELFSLDHTLAKNLLLDCEFPWKALEKISYFILSLGKTLNMDDYLMDGENVWIHKSVKRFPNVYIAGPTIIGEGTELRPGAFIRGSALIGKNCVVGNSTEVKNAIIFDNVEIPHYNYVGDSILGFKAHMGAGSIASNFKGDKKNIVIHFEDGEVETGIRKIGAILGDFVDVGCGSVLNPGTVVGKDTRFYPLSFVRGTVNSGMLYKRQGEVVEKF